MTFTLEAAEIDETCVGHAYGDTADFFADTDCTGLSRALYSAEVDGEPVVVSVTRVRLPDTATARDLRALTDRNGSGNVNDLLREGVRYTGAPRSCPARSTPAPCPARRSRSSRPPGSPRTPTGARPTSTRWPANGLALQVPAFPAE